MAFTQSHPQKEKKWLLFGFSYLELKILQPKVFQVTCLVTDDLSPITDIYARDRCPWKHTSARQTPGKHTQIPNTNKYRYKNTYKSVHAYINIFIQILYVTFLCISASNAQMQSSWRISPLTSVQSETFETICWCSQPPRGLRMEHVIPQSDGLMLLGQPRIPQH